MDFTGTTYNGSFHKNGQLVGMTHATPVGPIVLVYCEGGKLKPKRFSDLVEAEHFLLVNGAEPFPDSCSYLVCTDDCKRCPVKASLN